MSDPNSTDWLLIDRYLAGECSEADKRTVESLRAKDVSFRDALAAAEVVRNAGRIQSPGWDLDAVWRGVVRQTRDALDPAKVRMPTGSVRRRPPFPAWARLAAAFVFLIGGAAATWELLISPTYVTAAGERLTVTLADGTRLTLAPDSRLWVPQTFRRGRREVRLEGEAVFTVQHDPRHPFAVRTAQALAEDIGTTFDVKAYPEAVATRVVVAEGRVQVRGVSLSPDQLAVVGTNGVPAVTSGVDAANYLAWQTGRLVFNATSVPEALKTIGRWYDLDIRTTDSRLDMRHLTGSFTNASVDVVLSSVAAVLRASVDRQGRTVTLSPLGPGVN